MVSIEYPFIFMAGGALGLCAIAWRLWGYQYPRYRYSLTGVLARSASAFHHTRRMLLLLRILVLGALLIAAARLRSPDERTRVPMNGIDIMVALDVSGSMQCFDDINDQRTRFDVARSQAIEFIKRRPNDAVGLIFFGAAAISRCPLTLDKQTLADILSMTQLGDLNESGTMLATAIATGVHRMRNSQASSKVMIVLTDGIPSPGDMDPRLACELAKQHGITLYTIGVGSEEGGYAMVPGMGVVRVPQQLNFQLIAWLAQETGGRFFRVRSPRELEEVYGEIDKLATTSREAPVYQKYYEWAWYGVAVGAVLLLLEILLRTLVWRIV